MKVGVCVAVGWGISVGFAVLVGSVDCFSAIAGLTELSDGSVEHAASVIITKIKMGNNRFSIPLIFTSHLGSLLVIYLIHIYYILKL